MNAEVQPTVTITTHGQVPEPVLGAATEASPVMAPSVAELLQRPPVQVGQPWVRVQPGAVSHAVSCPKPELLGAGFPHLLEEASLLWLWLVRCPLDVSHRRFSNITRELRLTR